MAVICARMKSRCPFCFVPVPQLFYFFFLNQKELFLLHFFWIKKRKKKVSNMVIFFVVFGDFITTVAFLLILMILLSQLSCSSPTKNSDSKIERFNDIIIPIQKTVQLCVCILLFFYF